MTQCPAWLAMLLPSDDNELILRRFFHVSGVVCVALPNALDSDSIRGLEALAVKLREGFLRTELPDRIDRAFAFTNCFRGKCRAPRIVLCARLAYASPTLSSCHLCAFFNLRLCESNMHRCAFLHMTQTCRAPAEDDWPALDVEGLYGREIVDEVWKALIRTSLDFKEAAGFLVAAFSNGTCCCA